MGRVLVADDDPLIRRLLSDCLHAGGHHVISVADGAEAIQVITGNANIDLVVTDYQMPRADGIAVISAARRTDTNLPCIIVTALHDLDIATRATAEGAVEFVTKPFKPRHLMTVVERALESRSAAIEAMRLRVLAPTLGCFTVPLATAPEERDLSTAGHCQRLVHLTDSIATEIGLDPATRSHLRLGACLHDIGTVGMPENLLAKAARLDDHEAGILRRHPDIGADILADIDVLGHAQSIVRHHHERFDGSGYPQRLHGGAIPLGARIVAVADAFDVMRSGRPYSPPRAIEWIVTELKDHRGSQFDPDCVDAFLRAMDHGSVDLSPVADPGAPEPAHLPEKGGWLVTGGTHTTALRDILTA